MKNVENVRSFLRARENGGRPPLRRVYEDHLKNPTIATGLSLDTNTSTRAILASVGADFDAIRLGRAELTEIQAKTIEDRVIQDAEEIVCARIGREHWDVLGVNQQAVLISLCVNAPALIGPNLVQCLREHDYYKAADEIQYRSNQHHDVHLQKRREEEARLFRSEIGIQSSLSEDLENQITELEDKIGEMAQELEVRSERHATLKQQNKYEELKERGSESIQEYQALIRIYDPKQEQLRALAQKTLKHLEELTVKTSQWDKMHTELSDKARELGEEMEELSHMAQEVLIDQKNLLLIAQEGKAEGQRINEESDYYELPQYRQAYEEWNADRQRHELEITSIIQKNDEILRQRDEYIRRHKPEYRSLLIEIRSLKKMIYKMVGEQKGLKAELAELKQQRMIPLEKNIRELLQAKKQLEWLNQEEIEINKQYKDVLDAISKMKQLKEELKRHETAGPSCS